MGKHGKDAILDKNSKKIIFGDYRENYLANWIWKLNRDRSILSHETLYALKNAGFPFAEYSNERNDEPYAALVAYKENNYRDDERLMFALFTFKCSHRRMHRCFFN